MAAIKDFLTKFLCCSGFSKVRYMNFLHLPLTHTYVVIWYFAFSYNNIKKLIRKFLVSDDVLWLRSFLICIVFLFCSDTRGKLCRTSHELDMEKRVKLNIKISTPLKHNTNKALKNFWFLSNIVKHYLCFISFPGNKLLPHCKLWLYI